MTNITIAIHLMIANTPSLQENVTHTPKTNPATSKKNAYTLTYTLMPLMHKNPHECDTSMTVAPLHTALMYA